MSRRGVVLRFVGGWDGEREELAEHFLSCWLDAVTWVSGGAEERYEFMYFLIFGLGRRLQG